MIKDPVITKKIHFIRQILKDFAVAEKQNKLIFKHNMRVYTKYRVPSMWFAYTDSWTQQQKDELKQWVDNPWERDSITAIHVYYLKLKGVNKQHTKDDARYEASYIYKATTQRLEKEFQLSQEVGKEGIHVSSPT